MTAIDPIAAALESLRLGESIGYSEAAKKFGVDRSTLSRRHRGLTGSCAAKVESSRILSNAQEAELIRYIDELCSRALPPTRQMVRNFASEIAKKDAGKNWVDRFLKRHHHELLSHYTNGIDRNRFKADSAFKYSLYFELLRQKIDQYNVEPRHIYNMDEKGFLIGILSKQKRIFSREQYSSGKIRSLLQDGNREWITVLAAICADGTSLSPSLIYQAASGNIQDTWLQDFEPERHMSFFTSSPTGWTSYDIGLAWLQQVFDRETKEKAVKARRAYRLLILDGHGSHITMKFIKYCDDNRILLAIFPPHSTHTLQPLDVVMFSPLAAAYSAELALYMDMCQGLSSISKRDFFRFFYAAWSQSFTEKNIKKAFEATGLAPFNPQVILQRFTTKDHSRPSSAGSTTSVLSASDWRKIERLLREVVVDIYDDQARKLSQTIHTISVQKTLLQNENDRLKEALLNEKKRRQRGKPLLLQPAEQYNGGAVFWSPSKVATARERQHQKELDEELIQQQKSEAIRLRDEQ